MKYKEFVMNKDEGTMEFYGFEADLSDPDLATTNFR
jgi:hypothetical protein